MTTTIPPRYDLTPIQRIETAWRPPWLVCRMTQQGLRHYLKGDPSDDSHIVGGTGGVTWFAVADGVSTASLSRFGSRAACWAVDTHIGAAVTSGKELSTAILLEAMEFAHTSIVNLARQYKREAKDFATTLCVGALKGNTVMAASLGDSSVAISVEMEDFEGNKATKYLPFCTSKQSLQKGHTYSIHDPGWRPVVAVNETSNPAVSGLYMATDGGQNFFVDEDPNGNYSFDPAYPKFLERQVEQSGLMGVAVIFDVFMQKVEAENNDDRTLVVAYKVPSHALPPAPQS